MIKPFNVFSLYHRVMNYTERKANTILIHFGDFWPTSEPLSAVLGFNVLWVQGSTLVANTADRAKAQKSPKLKTMGVGGYYARYILYTSSLLYGLYSQ